MKSNVFACVMNLDLRPLILTEHKGVSSVGFFVYLLILCTALPKRRTGHNRGSLVLLWDRNSHFCLFFWSSNSTHTNTASSRSLGWSWWIGDWSSAKNLTPPRWITIVLPGMLVLENSHDLIAKKNAPMIRSAVWSSALFRTSLDVELAIQRSRSGVIAFCEFVPGETLVIAASKSEIFAVYPLSQLSCWWKGHCL